MDCPKSSFRKGIVLTKCSILRATFGTKKDAYLKGVFMTVKRDIDEAKQNSVNGKKSAEVCAERRRKEAMANLAAVIGGVIAAAESVAAGEGEGE